MKEKNKTLKPDFSWVNTLKGLAIMSILLIHYPDKDPDVLPAFCLSILNTGELGPQLFFILSACLAFFSIEKAGGITNLKEYRGWLSKRFLRLAPLFYVVLLLSLFVGGSTYWLGTEKTISVYNFLSTAFFVNGFFPHYINSTIGVNWYIADLALFYFVAPVLFKKINSVKRSVLFIGFSIGFSFVFTRIALRLIEQYVVVDVHIWENYIYIFCVISHTPTLGLGILLYHTMKTEWLEKYKKWWVLLLVAIGMVVLYRFFPPRGISFLTYHSVVIFLLILSLLTGKFRIDRFFVFPALGKYSYGIYLIHKYIDSHIYFFMAKIYPFDPVLLFLVVFVLTLALAYLFAVLAERGIEKPVRRFLENRFLPKSAR